MGKSRLLREASERARGAGMLVLRGRAASGAGQAPFRAVAEALAGGLRARAVPETSLRSFAPALAHVLPGWFERTSDAAPELVFLAEAVLRLLRLLAGARGVLLGLEDLQWADPESLALVEYLAENVGTERLLLVGTVRDDEPSAPLLSLRELARRGAMRWLELGRLDQDEVVKLAAARLGGAVPSSVSALLQARAEGLPLFVEELLGGLIAGDALRRAGCTPAAGLVPRTAAAPEATAARSAHTPLSRARTSFPAPAPPPSPAPHPAGTPAPAPSSGAQHPHIMINHRDRLLVLRQVDADNRAITRQHLAQPLPPRIPPPVPPGRAATLAHRTSSSLRLGHQARTTAPGGRSCINRTTAGQPPLARVVLLLRRILAHWARAGTRH